MATKTVELVEQTLREAFAPLHLDIVDNSWRHAGHAGNAMGGSHLAVTLVSERFEGLGPMQRHRLVHQSLEALMRDRIHALELKALPASAWQGEAG